MADLTPEDIAALRTTLEKVSAANDRIRATNEGILEYITGHQDDKKRADRILSTTAGGSDLGIGENAGGAHLAEVRSELLQERASMIKHREAIYELAHSAETLNKVLDKMHISQEEYANIQKDNSKANKRLIQQIEANTQIEAQRIVLEDKRTMPGRWLDYIEQSGIQQLRFGQLRPQDILRSAGTLAGQYYRNKAFKAKITDREGNLLYNEEGLPVERSKLSRGTRASLATAEMMTQFLPAVGQVLSAGAVIKDIVGRVVGKYQEYNRLGQITGAGMGEGVHMRWEATKISALQGGGPFDMITNAIAMEIVTGIAQRGFHGKIADAMASQLASVINDVGISVDSAANIMTDAMRRGGESLRDIADRMKTFDDAARSLNMSVQAYADSFYQLSTFFRSQGAATSTSGLSQTILAGAPRVLRDNPQALQQILTTGQGYLAAHLGMPIWKLYTPEGQKKIPEGIDWMVHSQAQMAQGTTIAEKAAWMNLYSPVFKGAGADVIASLLRNNNNFGRAERFREAGNTYARLFKQSEGTKTVHLGSLSKDQISRLSPDLQDKWMKMHQVGVPIDLSRAGPMVTIPDKQTIPIDRLKEIRQQMVKPVWSSLTDAERKEFMQHLGDRDFQVIKKLQEWESKPGRKGKSVSLGGVDISLKGDAAKWFQLERKLAAQYGQVPPNEVYQYPTQRTP